MDATFKTGGVQSGGMGTHPTEPVQRVGGVGGARKPPGGHYLVQGSQNERAGGQGLDFYHWRCEYQKLTQAIRLVLYLAQL